MSPALQFQEEMSGYLAFGESVPEIGYERGRTDHTRAALALRVVVDDVDAFIAGPERRAMVRGELRCEELGGVFQIESGEVQILPDEVNPHQGRMFYRVGVRTGSGRWLTARGVKLLQGGEGRSSLTTATRLELQLVHGRPVFGPGPAARGQNQGRPLGPAWDPVGPDDPRLIAAGILRMTLPAFAASLASFRPRARTRLAGAACVARFWAAVAGGFADIYLPAQLNAGRPSPEADAVVARRPRRAATAAPEPWRRVDSETWRDGLRVTSIPTLSARQGGPIVGLQHVEPMRGPKPERGPVLLLAGSSVAGSVFRPRGVRVTIIDRLLQEGYDVWVENWRGSLDHAPREYSLDEAAAVDHPAAVAKVAERAEHKEVKAVVHCLGSSGFMLALASGRLHTSEFSVTRVVSNSVSLHPMVPPLAEFKLRTMVPVYNRVLPYLDPQWAREEPMLDAPHDADGDGDGDASPAATPRGALGRLLVAWVSATHHECRYPVANFGQFMYGAGPATLYDESMLTDATARWMETQLSWAPARLYRQLGRSLIAGHLVPMRAWEPRQLKPNLFVAGPEPVDTRITFMTGTRNRCFSPSSQLRTFEWFSSYAARPDQHRFEPLEGYGHLDPWVSADQRPVHRVVLDGLER